MPRASAALAWLRRALALVLVVCLSACGANGCVEVTTEPPEPVVPDPLMLPGGAVARLTQHGFDVLAEQTVALLGLLFGTTPSGAAKVDVAALLGPIEIKVGGGLGLFEGKTSVRDLVLSLDLDSLEIALVEGSAPARIRLTFDHARIGALAGVVAGGTKVLGVGTDAACHLLDGLDVGTPQSRIATMSATVDVILGVDADGTLDLVVVVAKPVLHEIGFKLGQDCALKECTDQALGEDSCLECGLCATGELGSAAISGIKDLLGPLLSDLLEGATQLLLDELLLPGINDQPLDLEVPIDVRALVAASSAAIAAVFGPAEPLRVRVRPPAGAFTVKGGALIATLDAAAWAKASGCAVPVGEDASAAFSTPATGPAPPMPTVVATPAGERAVDLGLLVAPQLLEEAVWSLLRSGLACVHGDSAALAELSFGTIVLNAGAVDLVVPGLRNVVAPDAAVAVALRPSAATPPPGRVKLQPLAATADQPAGVRATVALKQVGVALEVEARWRWLTLLEARADLEVELDLRLEQGALAIAVAGAQLSALVVEDADLVDAAGLPAIAPALVDTALALLLAEPITLALDVDALLAGLKLPVDAVPLSVGVLGDGKWLWLAVGLAAGSAK